MDKLLKAALLTFAGITLAGFFARDLWLAELTTHFALHYVLCALMLALMFAVRRRLVLTLVSLGLLVFHVTQVAPYILPAKAAPAQASASLKLAQLNVFIKNTEPDAVIAWLKEHAQEFDAVLLQEVTPKLAARLPELNAVYPHQLLHPDTNAYGAALLTRLSAKAEWRDLEGGYNGYIYAELPMKNGGTAHLYGLHTTSPISRERAEYRQRELAGVAAAIRADTHPYTFLIGDLNIAPYSPFFADLLRESGLDHGNLDYPALGSWHALMPIPALRLPIDHLLVSRGLKVTERVLGPALGSDHRMTLSGLAPADK